MDTNDKAVKTVDFNRAKVSSTYKDISRQLLDTNDAVTRAIRRLQTSLEVETLIDIFMQELTALMRPGQLRYQSPEGNTYSFGDDSGAHNCQFNLAIDDTRLGKLSISRRKRYSEEEISIVELLASTLVFPLKNALMYQSALNNAMTDELTGMQNKRALGKALEREIDRAVRRQKPLAAIMLDIDHFKAINDTHGHIVGDKILSGVGQLLEDNYRQSDMCFRYGGEEFLILLDETDHPHAYHTAERIRELIEDRVFEIGDEALHITVSLGCTLFDGIENPESFLKRADQALYQAKRAGRNTAIFIPPTTPDQGSATINDVGGVGLN